VTFKIAIPLMAHSHLFHRCHSLSPSFPPFYPHFPSPIHPILLPPSPLLPQTSFSFSSTQKLEPRNGANPRSNNRNDGRATGTHAPSATRTTGSSAGARATHSRLPPPQRTPPSLYLRVSPTLVPSERRTRPSCAGGKTSRRMTSQKAPFRAFLLGPATRARSVLWTLCRSAGEGMGSGGSSRPQAIEDSLRSHAVSFESVERLMLRLSTASA
jgi:hypothetical protein